MIFMGQDEAYWIELKNRAEELDVTKLIKEIIDLRGTIAFYESRIAEIATSMGMK